jgi:hypothetical protein
MEKNVQAEFVMNSSFAVNFIPCNKDYNEEIHNLFSPNITRVIKSRTMEYMRNAHTKERRETNKNLGGGAEGKRPFQRPRLRWEVNVKTDLK